MLVDKQSELMSDLLFTVHQHGGDDETWKVFQIHAPGKCFISSILSKFWWYALHWQHKPPSSPGQRIFPRIFIATIEGIRKSFVCRQFYECVSDINSFLREYRLIDSFLAQRS